MPDRGHDSEYEESRAVPVKREKHDHHYFHSNAALPLPPPTTYQSLMFQQERQRMNAVYYLPRTPQPLVIVPGMGAFSTARTGSSPAVTYMPFPVQYASLPAQAQVELFHIPKQEPVGFRDEDDARSDSSSPPQKVVAVAPAPPPKPKPAVPTTAAAKTTTKPVILPPKPPPSTTPSPKPQNGNLVIVLGPDDFDERPQKRQNPIREERELLVQQLEMAKKKQQQPQGHTSSTASTPSQSPGPEQKAAVTSLPPPPNLATVAKSTSLAPAPQVPGKVVDGGAPRERAASEKEIAINERTLSICKEMLQKVESSRASLIQGLIPKRESLASHLKKEAELTAELTSVRAEIEKLRKLISNAEQFCTILSRCSPPATFSQINRREQSQLSSEAAEKRKDIEKIEAKLFHARASHAAAIEESRRAAVARTEKLLSNLTPPPPPTSLPNAALAWIHSPQNFGLVYIALAPLASYSAILGPVKPCEEVPQFRELAEHVAPQPGEQKQRRLVSDLVCPWDLSGLCADRDCPHVHTSEYALSDEAKVRRMVGSAPKGTVPDSVLQQAISDLKTKPFEAVIQSISDRVKREHPAVVLWLPHKSASAGWRFSDLPTLPSSVPHEKLPVAITVLPEDEVPEPQGARYWSEAQPPPNLASVEEELRKGNTSEALNIISRAIEKNPNSAALWKLHLTLFCGACSKPSEVLETFREADTAASPAVRHLELLWKDSRRSSVFRTLGERMAEGRRVLAAVRAAPGPDAREAAFVTADVVLSCARVLDESGRRKEAIAFLQDCIKDEGLPSGAAVPLATCFLSYASHGILPSLAEFVRLFADPTDGRIALVDWWRPSSSSMPVPGAAPPLPPDDTAAAIRDVVVFIAGTKRPGFEREVISPIVQSFILWLFRSGKQDDAKSLAARLEPLQDAAQVMISVALEIESGSVDVGFAMLERGMAATHSLCLAAFFAESLASNRSDAARDRAVSVLRLALKSAGEQKDSADTWICRCLLFELTGSDPPAVIALFKKGAAAVARPDDKKALWLRCAAFTARKAPKAIGDIVEEAISSVGLDIELPYSPSSAMTRHTARDWPFLNKLLANLLVVLPPGRHSAFFHKYAAERFPDDPDLAAFAVTWELREHKNWQRAVALARAAVDAHPCNPKLQLLHAEAEEKFGDLIESRAAFLKAVSTCPFDQALWKAFHEFEVSHGTKQSVEWVFKSSSARGIEIPK